MDAERETAVSERVRREWGFELPDGIWRFWAFLDALDPSERAALRDLDLSPLGISGLHAAPDARARDGVDIRVHGRYYRDPPEFLSFLHGGTDGLHYGLWFDDGRTCSGVASYYNNDGGGIDLNDGTPLEAVRTVLERCWRDQEADPDGYGDALRAGCARLREVLTGFETADRPETGLAYLRAHTHDYVHPPVVPGRITTLDGAGALAEGRTALDRPPHNGADEAKFAAYMYELFDDADALGECVAQAERWCAAGDPTEALLLGRDLHWASSGDPAREAHAAALLSLAYPALGRPALASLAAAHHRHRALPSVNLLT